MVITEGLRDKPIVWLGDLGIFGLGDWVGEIRNWDTLNISALTNSLHF